MSKLYYFLFYLSIPIGTAIYGNFWYFWWINIICVLQLIAMTVILVQKHIFGVEKGNDYC